MVDRRRPLVVERRSTAPSLEFVGILSGDEDRLSGVVGDHRVIATRDKSVRARVEFRLFSERLPRKLRPDQPPISLERRGA